MWLVTDEVSGRWRPGIGDPTVMGWLTVLAYVLAALLCAGAARALVQETAPGVPLDDRQRRLRRFWWGLTVAMFLLGVNKQFDLQTLLTEIGKDLAMAQGWYESRRDVQGLFVKLVAFLAMAVACFLSYRMRKFLRYTLWPLLGIVALLSFIVIRAASFHHLDLLLRKELLGVQTNWVFELSGIALVSWGGYRSGGGGWLKALIRRYAYKGDSPRLPAPVLNGLRRAGKWLAGGDRPEPPMPSHSQGGIPEERSTYHGSASGAHTSYPGAAPGGPQVGRTSGSHAGYQGQGPGAGTPHPPHRPAGYQGTPPPRPTPAQQPPSQRRRAPTPVIDRESQAPNRDELRIQVRVRDPGEER